jgi:hypothetical protein
MTLMSEGYTHYMANVGCHSVPLKIQCTLGYNEFAFIKKIKYTDPLMGATFKSKTHLLIKFLDFWRRFLRVWLQSLKKELIWPKIVFFLKVHKHEIILNFFLT